VRCPLKGLDNIEKKEKSEKVPITPYGFFKDIRRVNIRIACPLGIHARPASKIVNSYWEYLGIDNYEEYYIRMINKNSLGSDSKVYEHPFEFFPGITAHPAEILQVLFLSAPYESVIEINYKGYGREQVDFFVKSLDSCPSSIEGIDSDVHFFEG
jgi:phosphotransferase system HPr-like phosphotransfer protein